MSRSVWVGVCIIVACFLSWHVVMWGDNVIVESDYLRQVFCCGCELPKLTCGLNVDLGIRHFGQLGEVHCWGRWAGRLFALVWTYNGWILFRWFLFPSLYTRLIRDWNDFVWGLKQFQGRNGSLEAPCRR